MSCTVQFGTPTPKTWPSVSELPDYNDKFPKLKPKPITNVVKNLDPLGVDLLEKILVLDPAKRMSAKQALLHPYFEDLQNHVRNM
ncbi:hypothetical protein SARC_02343 [Sphaeroforma arctica JP610]|uniref:Protein kinase domain-containing protein n=1 Tax=Sphaeroforma arctica JP610 TaxID=667725 RepID=A0A0L0GB28_9EUKA|nr:hypothetical protein SARC_02343 [Sphaeroforma arctica JP610]KNC85473.1 hypothetical protein SARC_02343 [Sphaeroforma arctica JP610]|eukprot:XP_014159375.1 hypothetical protein SARC_02343 [Sphaeroforma arctica JP610]